MNVQGSPGIKHTREWGSISAPILHLPEDPEPAVKGGTNVHPSRVVESCENVCVGIYACGKAECKHTGLSLGRKDYIGV